MTAVRLEQPEVAVDTLLMNVSTNVYLPTGYNHPRPDGLLAAYLPGNGGTLIAVGLMAGGWEGKDGFRLGLDAENFRTSRTLLEMLPRCARIMTGWGQLSHPLPINVCLGGGYDSFAGGYDSFGDCMAHSRGGCDSFAGRV